MSEPKPLIILTGPTAVGKTKLSIELAKKINGSIISADSMQVYRYMDIGTAKITKKQMQNVPHYLIDEFDPKDEFHVVRFQEYAKRYMDEIYSKGSIPILVGGTGFYIQAVLYDIDFTKVEAQEDYRKELLAFAKEHGEPALHEKLRKIDPISAQSIHPNNVKRVIRALEYYSQTGNPISKHNEVERQKASPYRFAYFVLTDDRKILYDRINQRVDQMIIDGLIEEVIHLKELGYERSLVSMQGLGYKEIYSYLEGEYSLEEAIEQIKCSTRHFAKRQLTWFKREKDVIWLDRTKLGEDSIILEQMLRNIKNILK